MHNNMGKLYKKWIEEKNPPVEVQFGAMLFLNWLKNRIEEENKETKELNLNDFLKEIFDN